ncbi:MAG: CBS domain-containing protein [Candidatus Marinimicrobia bacterium]|nr:CBS domain-containing protein [Candidatus Neomarinimicrobiota bacterium]
MCNWKQILLKPDNTLEEAIKTLHEGGCRITLIIDDDGKLLGTLTDGDVRRALIKHISMDDLVVEVMNNKPETALKSDQRRQILSMMRKKKFLHMPIVNEQGVLVGLETLQHLIKNISYDNPVLLMAGGFGTRLLPLTKETPKPLLKVGKLPILETIITQFIDAGFHNFYISTHYKAEMVRKHFGDGSAWGVSIQYIHETKPMGTAGSLGLLPRDIQDLPILVMNGDLLTKVNFEHLLEFHKEQGGVATMCVREYDFQVPYGVIESKECRITSIVEKPVHQFFVNAGIYVLDPTLVKSVDGKTYLDMPSLLESRIEIGEQVDTFPLHEYWIDIGHLEEFERANREVVSIITKEGEST